MEERPVQPKQQHLRCSQWRNSEHVPGRDILGIITLKPQRYSCEMVPFSLQHHKPDSEAQSRQATCAGTHSSHVLSQEQFLWLQRLPSELLGFVGDLTQIPHLAHEGGCNLPAPSKAWAESKSGQIQCVSSTNKPLWELLAYKHKIQMWEFFGPQLLLRPKEKTCFTLPHAFLCANQPRGRSCWASQIGSPAGWGGCRFPGATPRASLGSGTTCRWPKSDRPHGAEASACPSPQETPGFLGRPGVSGVVTGAHGCPGPLSGLEGIRDGQPCLLGSTYLIESQCLGSKGLAKPRLQFLPDLRRWKRWSQKVFWLFWRKTEIWKI